MGWFVVKVGDRREARLHIRLEHVVLRVREHDRVDEQSSMINQSNRLGLVADSEQFKNIYCIFQT